METWLIGAISVLFVVLAYLTGKARSEGRYEATLKGLMTREEFQKEQKEQSEALRRDFKEFLQQRLEDLNLIGGD